MKKLLTLTAILISLNCFGQYSYEPLRVGVTKYNNTNSLIQPLDCGISQDTTKPTFIGFEEGRTEVTESLNYDYWNYKKETELTIEGLIKLYDEYKKECYNDSIKEEIGHAVLKGDVYYWQTEYIYKPRIEPNGLDDNFMNWLKTKQ